MSHPYWLILGIMTVAGLAGGWLNLLLLNKDDPDKSVARSLVGGLVASFTVPFFLSLISSTLIDSITGASNTQVDPAKVFVLLGFCLVAAVSSRAFISTISSRILNEAKAAKNEVKQIKKEVQPIIAQATESDPGESQPKFVAKLVSGTSGATDNEKKVLRALTSTHFTFRTLSGLSSEVGLDKDRVRQLLKELVDKDWVQGIEIMKDGKARARWHITEEGRAILASP